MGGCSGCFDCVRHSNSTEKSPGYFVNFHPRETGIALPLPIVLMRLMSYTMYICTPAMILKYNI